MALDTLLRFREKHTEAAFWTQFRDRLCTLDSLMTILVCTNSVISHIFLSRLVAEGVVTPLVSPWYRALGICLIIGQVAVLWLSLCHRDVYYSWRTVIVAGMRLGRYALAAGFTVKLSGRSDALVISYLLRSSSSTFVVLLKALGHRGFLFWANYFSLGWPLRFPLNAALHTLGALPILLHCAFCMARNVLSHEQLRQPVCSLASRLVLRAYQQQCHPLAPQLVAYSVSVRRISVRIIAATPAS